MVRTNFLMTAPLLMASFCSAQEKPNVVLILVDDMGYSDIGCYGGEILTPNIDALASKGVRFTQFYNTSRSCPARASLMTGLYQHQAGIGQMSEDPFANPDQKSPNDWGVQGYKGYLNRNCVTIAEVLKEDGYHTYMAGKWHLGMHGEEKWPLQRGFERFYGILSGACSYLRPSGGRGLTLDNTKLPAPDAPYYTTDAFADYAIQFVDEQKDDRPFFLYLAFNAPHWPLHAKEKDIQKFTKIYRKKGWDEIREARRKRMAKMGIIDSNTDFAEWENRKWDELTEQEKDQVAYRMAVYAAQVHCVDYNIGKLIDCLKKNHKMDNTLILFMSDNGACAEPYEELGGGKVEEVNNPASSFAPTYGRAWAQVSNTPFRKYKCRAYEGGISTPLILSWKGALGNKKGKWCRVPGYLPDIMPTILEATGAKYPETYHGGNKIYPLVGSSLFPAVHKKTDSLHEYMYWEHQNNRAIRWRDWKAIRDEKGKEWELYDVVKDRTERFNVAEQHPEVLTRLVTEWERWAHANFVLPKHPKKIKEGQIMNKLILGASMVVSATTLSFAQQVERPNIVIVLADDLGWGDVGFHGSEIKTPCLNALAAEGVVLDRFYTAPISTPTRAGLMTGRYPNRFGIRTTVIPPWREDGLDENEETLADMLARNGYSNRAIIGKWHLGHTRKVHYPINRGFSHFYGHLNGAIDYFDHMREGELDWHNDWETCYDKGYSTELITQEAVRCINTYEKEGPFLLYVAYNAPHTPLQAQEKDIELYCDDFGSLTPKEQKRVTYQAMVSCMDRGIGTIVDALKKKGIMDNTFLIFFSDNGPAGVPGSSSGKLRGRKFDEWDGGVRVPAVFYWKRAESNYKNLSSQVTGFVDIVPTLKELVGDKNRPERAYDGISILPLLIGSTSCIDRNFYLGCGAVVNKDYKLIRKGRKPGLNLPQDFLVDYQTDPYEKKNASNGNEQIVRSLYQVALKYDTITPCLPEIPYGKGREGFKAPVEWKVTR